MNIPVTTFCSLFQVLLLTALSAQKVPYFQQEVNYSIDVKLDDKNHLLTGFETFEYINNSPDELAFLYIHLWPNAYKNRSTALAKQLARSGRFVLFSSLREQKGYIDSLDFRVNGVAATLTPDPIHIDIAVLQLPQPLKPGERITVTTPFVVKIPSGSISRLGHVGESYQITQWYPKPAVYDRDGWHPMPYLSQGEFYSEFGSFDVRITLPQNYVVGATGDLQTESEVAFLDKLAAKGTDRPDLMNTEEFPPSSPELKTIRYTQSRVHDFAWFADKRWMVLKGQVTTPHEGREVTIWAMFTTRQKELWQKAPEYLKDAIHYYSLWNGDYPYNQVTAVDGTISAGAGMEYPTITVIGGAGNARELETVIVHEVGHNWFYGILGSNERRDAWLDEGINSFNEERYMETKYPDSRFGDAVGLGALADKTGFGALPQRTFADLLYRFNASRNLDQPLQCHAEEFTTINYGGIVYKKTALLFFYLKATFGEEVFDRCMRSYFEEWKFKHPGPDDLRAVFQQVTQTDVGWFFEDLVRTSGKIDFALKQVKSVGPDEIKIKVKNTGQTRGPAIISQLTKDTEFGKSISPSVVTSVLAPGQSEWVHIPRAQGAHRVMIDANFDIPQINRRNDRMRIQGVARKIEPLSLKPVTGLEIPSRTQLFWIPMIAWNDYDKWMPGITLHNKTITQKPFEWSVSPLYSISSDRLNGFARAEIHSGLFTAGIRGQQFSDGQYSTPLGKGSSRYALAEPYAKYTLRPKTNSVNESLTIQLDARYQLNTQSTSFSFNAPDATFTQQLNQQVVIMSSDITWERKPRHEWRVGAGAVINSEIVNLSDAQSIDAGDSFRGHLVYRYLYNTRIKKHVQARLFAGTTTRKGTLNLFSPSGVTGQADFFYDGLYLGRGERTGILSRQMNSGMGMLRTPLPWLFRSLVAMNVDFELPVGFPLKLSGNIAASDLESLADRNELMALLVLSVPLVRDVLEVHVPIAQSSSIRDVQSAMGYSFADRIMFTLRIDALAPFHLIRNLAP